MAKCEDLTGKRFGRLTAICRANKGNRKSRNAYWLCKCDCGNETIVNSYKLKSGHTKSCGCYREDTMHLPHPKASKHYMSKTRPYRIWSGMVDRCTNKNSPDWSNYGGRGITVCDEWRTFGSFYEWLNSSGYSDDLQLDRIDNNRGYSPSNCRWVTVKTNSRNRRTNVLVNYEGESHCLAEWCEIKGMNYNRFHQRMKSGWSFEDAIETPVGGRHV